MNIIYEFDILDMGNGSLERIVRSCYSRILKHDAIESKYENYWHFLSHKLRNLPNIIQVLVTILFVFQMKCKY
jgi:hypothetical protein